MNVKFNNVNMGSVSYDILCRSAARVLDLRSVDFGKDGDAYVITLKVDGTLKNDRYIIESDGATATITAANDLTVHAAFGRLMLESTFDGMGGFEPYSGKIDFTPKSPLRGMYFATHFYNFYHNAPIEKVYEVIEDLAMRGCNNLLVWFDMHHFDSMRDAGAVELTERLRAMIKYANLIGIKGSLTMLSNEGFRSSPEALRADWEVQGNYKSRPDGHYHVEICPSKEGGIEEIIRERREMLSCFNDLDIGYVCYWPYDQGGCTCPQCQPWGANGLLKLFPHFKKLIGEMMPDTRIIFSTWYFDKFIDGEWDAFYPHMTDGTLDGVDYIMSFFFNGQLPKVIEENGIPEGIKFIDFPEISMYTCVPWGGFGASQLARFLDRTNAGSGKLYSGGFPYSEGIFEDMNKFFTQTYYSGLYDKTSDAMRAYIKYEFCVDGEALDELTEAIAATETGLARDFNRHVSPVKAEISDKSEVEKVYRIMTKYNSLLPEKIRTSRNFRLFYLRAVIDRELVSCDGEALRSEICQRALREVSELYYADERTHRWIKPPLGL